MLDNLALAKGSAISSTMAEDITEELGLKFHETEIKDFSDGEIYFRFEETVRGRDCFLIQSICRSSDHSVNDNLMELLLAIDASKRASAKSISTVIPYYGYARQDRKTTGREPISAKLIADILAEAGADRVLTIDLHSGQIQGFFDIPVDNLASDMKDIMINAVKKLKRRDKKNNKIIISSLDVGGAKKARRIANKINAELVIINKKRNGEKDVEVMDLIGDVEGKNIIFIDDIVSTAGTLVEGAESVRKRGAEKIWGVITHGIFAEDAVDKIESSPIKKILVTDSIPPLGAMEKSFKIEYIRVGSIIGRVIERIYKNRSVSEEFSHT